MIEEASQVLQGLDARTPVAVRKARFVEPRDGFAVVDMGDSRFIADFVGYVPVAGETVQIVSVGERHLLFPAGPKPGIGTVLTVTAGVVTAQTIAGVVAMPYMGTAPSSGDLIGISWSEGPRCQGKLSSTLPTPAPIPDPGGGTLQSATFRAIDAGSTDRTQSRWWQAQPWASNTTYGAWFYGTQIRDTIPAGATLVSLEFFAAWASRSGGAPRFALHNLAAKTAVPSFGAYTEWVPGDGWQTPPMAAAWFAALKAGGASLGVGLNQGGWNQFSSLAQNSMTGALRISWR